MYIVQAQLGLLTKFFVHYQFFGQSNYHTTDSKIYQMCIDPFQSSSVMGVGYF